ncbi:MAG: bifunctional hexulose-6-phosphate synthase/ribonuclease regulator [Actinobacteria bacterium]|nr:bifunctional hexulose-6-phosphate synthase/ribonuclease regulator [Actinomycetota bacterium]
MTPETTPGTGPGAEGCDPGRERPIVQVALDFVDLPRAVEVAREAVAGGADWIEAGTPLIKAEGLNAVRTLKAEFPDTIIVADMKTMDAGRTEVEYAAKAGAGVVGVLGAASDSTIRECAEAARTYGCKLIVDMIEVADPVARARRAQELGADYIGIHTAIDQQMRGEAPFETLRAVAEAVDLPVSVAGGINSETAAAAVDAGAAVVVVGGAIIKSADAAAAAAEIRRAVDERVCIETTLYKRVGADDIRAALEKVSTANLSDAWHRQPSLPGIRPLLPGAHMCGPAVTVRTYAGDWAKPVKAIDVCRPGDVLVVDACDATPAMWGELATHSAMVKGLAGLVVWGAIRDTPEIARLRFPAFSSKVCANAGEPKGLGEINVPVTIAGQTVRPGDWIVGDDDGVMVLPREQAVELANRAMDVLEKENRLRGEIDAGKTLAEVAYLQKWEKR